MYRERFSRDKKNIFYIRVSFIPRVTDKKVFEKPNPKHVNYEITFSRQGNFVNWKNKTKDFFLIFKTDSFCLLKFHVSNLAGIILLIGEFINIYHNLKVRLTFFWHFSGMMTESG